MNRQEKFILLLSGALLLLAFFGLLIAPKILHSFRSSSTDFIGMVLEAEGETKMRFGDSVNWKPFIKKDKIYSRVYLFTGNNSSGSFAFLDESVLNLGSNSLVFIDLDLQNIKKKKALDELAIELVDGEMKIDLKSKAIVKNIRVADASINLSDQNSVLKVNYNDQTGMQVSVMKGNVDIATKDSTFKVKHGEKLEISKNEEKQVIEPVPQEIMEEMRRMSEADRRALLEEMQRKRGLSQVAQEFIRFLSNFSI